MRLRPSKLRTLAALAGLALIALAAGTSGAMAQYGPLSIFDIFRPRQQQPQMMPRRQYHPYGAQRRRAAPRTVIVQDTNKPKVDPSNFVVIIGDGLAEHLAQGLDEAFEDKPDTAIVEKAKGDSGLVRTEVYDWPKAVGELLSGKDKITLGVIMIGSNDRQAITENGETHQPGTQRWGQIYAARVDAIVRAFAEKKIPLIWVGLPPMKNDRFSADVAELNTFYRDRVQQGGAFFVDVWEAFADDDNRYSAYGPGLSGQTMKLRTADGVHFTKAGSRKLAHFVDIEIKRLIDTQPPTVVAMPSQPASLELDLSIPGNLERLIDQAIKPLPELQGGVVLPVKPIAGPIVTLTKSDVAAGGQLAAGARVRTPGEAGVLIERVFDGGRTPEPRSGRADDFRWPKQ